MSRTSKMVVVERIALIIATSVAVIFMFLYFQEEPVIYDNTLIESQYKKLESEKRVLEEELRHIKELNAKRSVLIDSLETLKPTIEYVYIEKENEIDTLSAISITNEFTNIFTDNGIE